MKGRIDSYYKIPIANLSDGEAMEIAWEMRDA